MCLSAIKSGDEKDVFRVKHYHLTPEKNSSIYTVLIHSINLVIPYLVRDEPTADGKRVSIKR